MQGSKNRSTGATLMNKDSSRSHSIFTISVEMSEIDGKGKLITLIIYKVMRGT